VTAQPTVQAFSELFRVNLLEEVTQRTLAGDFALRGALFTRLGRVPGCCG